MKRRMICLLLALTALAGLLVPAYAAPETEPAAIPEQSTSPAPDLRLEEGGRQVVLVR